MRQNVGPQCGCHIGSILWRPTTMFPDHENPSNIAAAAAPAPSTNEASTSDQIAPPVTEQAESANGVPATPAPAPAPQAAASAETPEDRKSTRLNSSHTVISYAVFCLKKKKKKKKVNTTA